MKTMRKRLYSLFIGLATIAVPMLAVVWFAFPISEGAKTQLTIAFLLFCTVYYVVFDLPIE